MAIVHLKRFPIKSNSLYSSYICVVLFLCMILVGPLFYWTLSLVIYSLRADVFPVLSDFLCFLGFVILKGDKGPFTVFFRPFL